MDSFTEATSAATTERVACNGLVFPLLRWGRPDARPVLLLHGFPQEPLTWSAVAEALAGDGLYVHAPFQRGYAGSARPIGLTAYTFAQFADDVIAIAGTLGLERFDLVGFGVGAVQAWMVAARHSARVRSLTSIRFPHPAAFAEAILSDAEQSRKWSRLQEDLGAGNPAQKATAMLADAGAGLRRFLTASGLPEPFLSRYVSRLSEPGALAGALSWNQAISLEEFSTVPTVTVPTLLIWSEGPALGRAAAEASRSYVQASFTAVSVPEVNHFLLETFPAAVIEPLRQHLRET
jgi:pimeloyl-ACP methyl ester carboxylesterase